PRKGAVGGAKLEIWANAPVGEALRPRPRDAPPRQVAALGGPPEQRALSTEGRADSAVRPLCGAEERAWRCRSPERDCAGSPTGGLAVAVARLVADPAAEGRWQLPEAELRWVKPGGPAHFSGGIDADGSMVNPSWPRLRAGGWAVVVRDNNALEQGLRGPLPVPATCSLAPEIWVIIDNEAVVDGLLAGRARCCGGGSVAAHLWRRLWGVLEDGQLAPAGENLAVAKIKARVPGAERHAPSVGQRASHVLDDEADKFAKMGAAACPVPTRAAVRAGARSKWAKCVPEYVA
ncbi:unnamed protein product, partial [Prorocentrum cordatum]